MRVLNQWVILLLQVAVTTATITTPPRDQAAKKDTTNVQLNCTSDKDSKDLEWKVLAPWSLMPIKIFPSANSTNFTSAPDGSSIYINSLTDDLATVYTCQDDPEDQNPPFARVASIGFLDCPDEVEVPPGDLVVSECSVTYASNIEGTLAPLLLTIALLDQKGTVLDKVRATQPGALKIQLNQTAQNSFNEKPFQCSIFFEGEDEGTASEANLPTFTETCDFNIFVLQSVSEVTIDESLNPNEVNRMFVDDVINCTADGRPEPAINWLDSEGQVLSDNGTLLLTPEMVGERLLVCRATQTGAENHVASANITVSITNREQQVQEAGVAPWVIAISIIIPLLVILLIIVLIVFCCLKKRKSLPYKPKSSRLIKGKSNKKEKGTKTAYSSAPTSDVTFTPSRGPASAPDQTNKVPTRPIYNNANNKLASQASTDAYANQKEFGMGVGHGALGMPGMGESKQDGVGTKGSNGDFPPPPKKQPVLQSYNPMTPNGRNPRPPLSDTDSQSPSGRGASKKKPVPLQRPPSINSTSTNRSLMSSEVTSGGEGRVPQERRKKKKGGEYVVSGKSTSPPPPPDQYRQKSAKPSTRKNPASPPKRQEDSDGSEV